MQNEIHNLYLNIPFLEPCDKFKMRKYRLKDDKCTNKQIAKRRKRIKTVKRIGENNYGNKERNNNRRCTA